jgi:hypothetical protein
VDASGQVGVGTTTPSLAMDVLSTGLGLRASRFTTSTGTGAGVEFRKSASATIGTNTILANGETIGRVIFSGADGSSYPVASEITAIVDGTPSTNDMPGRLVFSTTADGASSPTERMRITSAGNVGIGITPSVALDVVGVIEAQAAATQDAVRIQGRAGGSSSYSSTITPATLTASRTVTLPDATGTAMVSGAMPTFRAYANANQTVTLSTFTKIAIDTEDFDTASCFDTSLYRFTPNVEGYYQVNGTLRAKVVTTFNTILLSLYKNGSGYTRTQVLASLAANNNNAISTNEVVYMNGTTDYLELYGLLGGSGTATFDATSSTITSTFSAVLVRAA